MKLDDIAVTLRGRNGFEAADLGFAVARNFWKPLYGAWLACLLPIFAVATVAAVLTSSIAIPLLAVWLLKPLYDRIPLFVVSRSLFGDEPGARRTIRHALSRWFSVDGFFDTTIRRLSPYRAFVMPIRELEGATGEKYKPRKKALLRRDAQGPSLMLMAVFMAIEQMTVLAVFAFALMLVPPEWQTGPIIDPAILEPGATLPTWLVVLAMVAYFLAVSLVEVFYVAGCFGLYINRRVQLEGWDVELEFKRMARRLKSRKSKRVAGLLLAAVAAAGLSVFGVPQTSYAESDGEAVPHSTSYTNAQQQAAEDQPALEAELSSEDPQKRIDEILEADEFGQKEEQWTWENRSEKSIQRESPFDVGELGGAVGLLLELALWVLVGIAIVGFAVYVLRTASDSTGSKDEEPEVRPEPAVVDPEEEPAFHLPEELVQRAVEEWERGNVVASLSALYRGTIRGLSDHHGIDIAPYMTARECTRKVRAAGGPGTFVARLSDAWSSTAYAGRPPSDQDARELFRDWRDHFAGGER